MSTLLEQTSNKFWQSIKVAFWLTVTLWGIHLFQVITTIDFGTLGVYPRKTFGLKGILFSPLIHSGWPHLLSNTPPFFALTFILFFFYRRAAIPSFISIYLLTGLSVWAFARDNAFHIGASGVVYGLVAFVFWSGIFRRNIKSIVLALVVVVYYSGMFAGLVPTDEKVSWESHLFGALVGIFVAFWFKNRIDRDERKPVWSWEKEPDSEQQYLLERDAFDKTKAERERERKQREGGDWFSTQSW